MIDETIKRFYVKAAYRQSSCRYAVFYSHILGKEGEFIVQITDLMSSGKSSGSDEITVFV